MMIIVKRYISRIPTIPIYPIYILSDPIRSHRYPLLRLNNGQVRRIHQAREHRAGGTGRLMSCPKARIKRPKLSWFQGDFPPFWAAESAGSGSATYISQYIPIYWWSHRWTAGNFGRRTMDSIIWKYQVSEFHKTIDWSLNLWIDLCLGNTDGDTLIGSDRFVHE